MSFFDFFRGTDINDGVRRYLDTPGSLLVDVRTPQEYRQGHIPGSRNFPLGETDELEKQVPDRETPLFVYCLSGSRSGRAAGVLRRMGYKTVINIGGISGYRGKVER